MRELIEKWRRQGKHDPTLHSTVNARREALRDCADELEAALNEQDAKLRKIADGFKAAYTDCGGDNDCTKVGGQCDACADYDYSPPAM